MTRICPLLALGALARAGALRRSQRRPWSRRSASRAARSPGARGPSWFAPPIRPRPLPGWCSRSRASSFGSSACRRRARTAGAFSRRSPPGLRSCSRRPTGSEAPGRARGWHASIRAAAPGPRAACSSPSPPRSPNRGSPRSRWCSAHRIQLLDAASRGAGDPGLARPAPARPPRRPARGAPRGPALQGRSLRHPALDRLEAPGAERAVHLPPEPRAAAPWARDRSARTPASWRPPEHTRAR